MKHGFLRVCTLSPVAARRRLSPIIRRKRPPKPCSQAAAGRRGSSPFSPSLASPATPAADLFLQPAAAWTPPTERCGEADPPARRSRSSAARRLCRYSVGRLLSTTAPPCLLSGRAAGPSAQDLSPHLRQSSMSGRHFYPRSNPQPELSRFAGQSVPLGTNLLFRCRSLPGFCLGVEICEDLWVNQQPSELLRTRWPAQRYWPTCLPATRPSARTTTAGSSSAMQSARQARAPIIYADAGHGESTTDHGLCRVTTSSGENGCAPR